MNIKLKERIVAGVMSAIMAFGNIVAPVSMTVDFVKTAYAADNSVHLSEDGKSIVFDGNDLADYQYITEDYYNKLKKDGIDPEKASTYETESGWTNFSGGLRMDGSGYSGFQANDLPKGSMPINTNWYGQTVYFRKEGLTDKCAVEIPAITSAESYYKEDIRTLTIKSHDAYDFYGALMNGIKNNKDNKDNSQYEFEYAKGKYVTITNTTVIKEDFNQNPRAYLFDAAGDPIFDSVIWGGNVDSETDLSPAAYFAMKEYLSNGYGLMVGHDTLYAYAGSYYDNFKNSTGEFAEKYYGKDDAPGVVDTEKLEGLKKEIGYVSEPSSRYAHFWMNQLIGWNDGNYESVSKNQALAVSPSGIVSIGSYNLDRYGKLANQMYGNEEAVIKVRTWNGADAQVNPTHRQPTNFPYSEVMDVTNGVYYKFDPGAIVGIGVTHSNGGVAYGTVWASFNGTKYVKNKGVGADYDFSRGEEFGTENGGTNNFYIAGVGNIVQNQIGHVNPGNVLNNEEEYETAKNAEGYLLINTLFYISQRKQCEICQSGQASDHANPQVHFVHRVTQVNAKEVLAALKKGGTYHYPIDDCYMLTEDVKLSTTDFTEAGNIEGFKGHWNANGHTIKKEDGTKIEVFSNPNEVKADITRENNLSMARVVGFLNTVFHNNEDGGVPDAPTYAGYTVKFLIDDNRTSDGRAYLTSDYTILVNNEGKYVVSGLPSTYNTTDGSGVLIARVFDRSGVEVTQYGVVCAKIPEGSNKTTETVELQLYNYEADPVADVEVYEDEDAEFVGSCVYKNLIGVDGIKWEFSVDRGANWQDVSELPHEAGEERYVIANEEPQYRSETDDYYMSTELTIRHCEYPMSGYMFRTVFSASAGLDKEIKTYSSENEKAGHEGILTVKQRGIIIQKDKVGDAEPPALESATSVVDGVLEMTTNVYAYTGVDNDNENRRLHIQWYVMKPGASEWEEVEGCPELNKGTTAERTQQSVINNTIDNTDIEKAQYDKKTTTTLRIDYAGPEINGYKVKLEAWYYAGGTKIDNDGIKTEIKREASAGHDESVRIFIKNTELKVEWTSKAEDCLGQSFKNPAMITTNIDTPAENIPLLYKANGDNEKIKYEAKVTYTPTNQSDPEKNIVHDTPEVEVGWMYNSAINFSDRKLDEETLQRLVSGLLPDTITEQKIEEYLPTTKISEPKWERKTRDDGVVFYESILTLTIDNVFYKLGAAEYELYFAPYIQTYYRTTAWQGESKIPSWDTKATEGAPIMCMADYRPMVIDYTVGVKWNAGVPENLTNNNGKRYSRWRYPEATVTAPEGTKIRTLIVSLNDEADKNDVISWGKKQYENGEEKMVRSLPSTIIDGESYMMHVSVPNPRSYVFSCNDGIPAKDLEKWIREYLYIDSYDNAYDKNNNVLSEDMAGKATIYINVGENLGIPDMETGAEKYNVVVDTSGYGVFKNSKGEDAGIESLELASGYPYTLPEVTVAGSLYKFKYWRVFIDDELQMDGDRERQYEAGTTFTITGNTRFEAVYRVRGDENGNGVPDDAEIKVTYKWEEHEPPAKADKDAPKYRGYFSFPVFKKEEPEEAGEFIEGGTSVLHEVDFTYGRRNTDGEYDSSAPFEIDFASSLDSIFNQEVNIPLAIAYNGYLFENTGDINSSWLKSKVYYKKSETGEEIEIENPFTGTVLNVPDDAVEIIIVADAELDMVLYFDEGNTWYKADGVHGEIINKDFIENIIITIDSNNPAQDAQFAEDHGGALTPTWYSGSLVNSAGLIDTVPGLPTTVYKDGTMVIKYSIRPSANPNSRKMFADFNFLETISGLENVKFDKVEIADYMFENDRSLSEIAFNIQPTDSSLVKSMQGMFQNCYNLTSIDMKLGDDNKELIMENLTSTQSMFNNCNKLQELPIEKITAKNLTNASYMFYATMSLKNVDVGTLFDLGGSKMVENTKFMFYGSHATIKTRNDSIYAPTITVDAGNVNGTMKAVNYLDWVALNTVNTVELTGEDVLVPDMVEVATDLILAAGRPTARAKLPMTDEPEVRIGWSTNVLAPNSTAYLQVKTQNYERLKEDGREPRWELSTAAPENGIEENRVWRTIDGTVLENGTLVMFLRGDLSEWRFRMTYLSEDKKARNSSNIEKIRYEFNIVGAYEAIMSESSFPHKEGGDPYTTGFGKDDWGSLDMWKIIERNGYTEEDAKEMAKYVTGGKLTMSLHANLSNGLVSQMEDALSNVYLHVFDDIKLNTKEDAGRAAEAFNTNYKLTILGCGVYDATSTTDDIWKDVEGEKYLSYVMKNHSVAWFSYTDVIGKVKVDVRGEIPADGEGFQIGASGHEAYDITYVYAELESASTEDPSIKVNLTSPQKIYDGNPLSVTATLEDKNNVFSFSRLNDVLDRSILKYYDENGDFILQTKANEKQNVIVNAGTYTVVFSTDDKYKDYFEGYGDEKPITTTMTIEKRGVRLYASKIDKEYDKTKTAYIPLSSINIQKANSAYETTGIIEKDKNKIKLAASKTYTTELGECIAGSYDVVNQTNGIAANIVRNSECVLSLVGVGTVNDEIANNYRIDGESYKGKITPRAVSLHSYYHDNKDNVSGEIIDATVARNVKRYNATSIAKVMGREIIIDGVIGGDNVMVERNIYGDDGTIESDKREYEGFYVSKYQSDGRIIEDGLYTLHLSADNNKVIEIDDDIEIWEYNGNKYIKVFAHDLMGGYFATTNAAMSYSGNGMFSVLSDINKYHKEFAVDDSKWEFMLYYPNEDKRIIWKQKENPLMTPQSAGVAKVDGLEITESNISEGDEFNGLVLSNSGKTLLCGNTNGKGITYAIGQFEAENGGIAAYNSNSSSERVELWMRVNDDYFNNLSSGLTISEYQTGDMNQAVYLKYEGNGRYSVYALRSVGDTVKFGNLTAVKNSISLVNGADAIGMWIIEGYNDKFAIIDAITGKYIKAEVEKPDGSYYNIVYNNAGELGKYSPTKVACNASFKVSTPINPGYIFNGWNISGMSNEEHIIGWRAVNGTTATGVTDINFASLGQENDTITFTATWTKAKYEIAYELNGGTAGGEMKTTVNYDEEFEIPIPVKSGYRFDGWKFTNMTSTNHKFGDTENSLSEFKSGSTATKFMNLRSGAGVVQAEAQWTGNGYTVKVLEKTGTVLETINDATYGTAFAIKKAQRTGYTLTGYTMHGAMTGITHYSGTSPINLTELTGTTVPADHIVFKDLAQNQGTTVELIANWKANEYNIYYELGNVPNAKMGINEPASAKWDDTITISNPACDGYVFNGWTIAGTDTNTHSRGNTLETTWNTKIITGVKDTKFKNLNATDGATVTFTATWINAEYSIEYDITGGVPTTARTWGYEAELGVNKPNSAGIGEWVEISNPVLGNGYEFVGWTITGMDGSTHYIGISETDYRTSKETSLTNVKETMFKGLASAGGTVKLTAVFKDVAKYVKVPDVSATTAHVDVQSDEFDLSGYNYADVQMHLNSTANGDPNWRVYLKSDMSGKDIEIVSHQSAYYKNEDVIYRKKYVSELTNNSRIHIATDGTNVAMSKCTIRMYR